MSHDHRSYPNIQLWNNEELWQPCFLHFLILDSSHGGLSTSQPLRELNYAITSSPLEKRYEVTVLLGWAVSAVAAPSSGHPGLPRTGAFKNH